VRREERDALSIVLALIALAAFCALCLAAAADDPTLDLPVQRPTRPTVAPTPPPQPQHHDDGPPPAIYGAEIRAEDSIAFVIDESGSMAYGQHDYTDAEGNVARGNRLDRAKAELLRCLASLPESITLDVLAYDCSTSAWQGRLVPATPAARASAGAWVLQLRPGGGTGTGPAVVQAIHEGPRLVVLLTDGSPNCGAPWPYGGPATDESHRSMIRAANTRGARIDVFGIGATGSLEQWCRNVAGDSGGQYVCVP